MASITPQVEQLPIFGIARNAALALRVRQKDGQVCYNMSIIIRNY
jgi:hypothetical protein